MLNLFASAMVLSSFGPAEPPQEPMKIFALEAKPAATDTALQKLQKERFAVCKEELKQRDAFMKAASWDVSTINQVLSCIDNLTAAYLATEPNDAGKLAGLEAALEFSAHCEQILQKRLEAGALRKDLFLQAKAHRLQKEIDLLKFKEKK